MSDDAYMQQDDDIEMDVAGSDEEDIDDSNDEDDEDDEEQEMNDEEEGGEDEEEDEEPPPPVEEDAAIARRRAIQAIMRDNTLSGQEKSQRIQDLMSNGRTHVAPPPAPVLPVPEANAACVHYERNCNIVAPCCNRVFGCRICHDELSPTGHPPMNRFLVREVVCKNCNTRQQASYVLKNCPFTLNFFCFSLAVSECYRHGR